MKVFTRQELRSRLKRKEISPIYLLFGAETYLRDLACHAIRNISLKGASALEFNDIEFSLNKSSVGEAIASAEQFPVIDPKRVVLITNLRATGNKQGDNLTESDESLLKSYLLKPSETSVLIFVADEFDKRRRISRLLLENSCAVEFKHLRDGELIRWAKERFSELNAQIDEKALRHLVVLVGNDVRKLNMEIEKLSIAAAPNSLITCELVSKIVPNSRKLSNFELTDYLLSGNKSRVLGVMRKILDDGAEPLMLLGLLSYNFRRLLMAKEMINDGMDYNEISRIMRLPYNKEKEFLETARRTSESKLSRVLGRLFEADLAVKTSIATPQLYIEMLVCELAAI